MIKHIKIVLLSLLLIASLTACKAEIQINNNPDANLTAKSDSIKSVDPQPGEWLTNYQQALDAAKKSNKPIVMNFTGSDWCIWCKKLSKEVFTQKPFIDYATANLVLLKLDFPKSIKQTDEEKQQNESLAKQFKIEGFPTLVILDKNGKEINRASYQEGGAEKYVEYLKALIAK